MTKWFRDVVNRRAIGSSLFRCGARRDLAMIGLVMAALLAGGPRIARCAEPSRLTLGKLTEGSLLVGPREMWDAEPSAAAGSPADDDALEPISQSTERTPEIAAEWAAGWNSENHSSQRGSTAGKPITTAHLARDDDGVQFGAALSEAGRSQSPRQPGAAQSSDSAHRSSSVPFEPVKFQGILVGKSTRQEVVSSWGEPAQSIITVQGEVLAYDIEPFQAVDLLIAPAGVVSAIKISLAAPLGANGLAEQLSLDEYQPVTALDEHGVPLGQAFPERGVVFMFDEADVDALGDAARRDDWPVSHVVVQPLDPQAFAMRAADRLHGPYTKNISDLKTAIALDPSFAYAHWQLARIHLATGQADLADAAAAKACQLDSHTAAYQLCRGQTQELLGEYDSAVLTVRAVLDRDDLAPMDRAQALFQMARLASLGDVEIASKAIGFYTRAIELADGVATSRDRTERRAAKQLLVEAHVAVAEEIARQSFNQKVESLSLWIGRASGLAEEYIANDGGSLELRLLIAQRALAALASFRPTLDPAPWVAEAEEAAQALQLEFDDEMWRQRIRWELGLAYLHALRVEHARRETAAALKYGKLAVDNLAEGAASRQAVHATEQLIGQLYFQMGAVYAVHQLDHAKAALWYDKAEPLLGSTRPASELYAPRREGEMLVSMGVTYWQLGDQERAMRLSQKGVGLVEIAVEGGILAQSTLAVPYGNLATMYKQLGDTAAASKYADLAKKVGAAPSDNQPRLGSTPIAPQNAGPTSASAQQSPPSQQSRPSWRW